MSLTRRGFFGLLAGATAAAVALPDLELLVLTRTIFLPPKGGWLLTPRLIAEEALRILHENMRFTSYYDISMDQLVGRHDILLGDEQLAVDQILAPDYGEKESAEVAARLFKDTFEHRGLSTISIRRPPRYSR